MNFVLIIAAAAVLGAGVLRREPAVAGDDRWLFRLLCGLALVAVITLVIGSFSLKAAQVVLALVAVGALAGEFLVRRPRTQGEPPATPDRLSRTDYGYLGVITAALLMALMGCLAPATAWESCAVHLALPAAYAREGRIAILEQQPASGGVQLLHALNALAYSGGGEWPVAMLNVFLGGLACAAVYALGKRVAGQRCGLIAAAILATAPVFLEQTANVTEGMAFTAFTVGALAAFLAWRDTNSLRLLAVSAFLAGSSYGLRYSGLLTTSLLAVAVIAFPSERRFRALGVFVLVAAIGAAPWLLRSLLVPTNPIYPYVPTMFPRRNPAFACRGRFELVPPPKSLLEAARLAYDLLLHPNRFDGWAMSPGGLVLILGVPGCFLAGRRSRWIALFTLVGGAIIFRYQRDALTFVAHFAVLMALAAAAVLRSPWLRRSMTAVLVLFFALGLTLHAAVLQPRLAVLLGRQTPEAYLEANVARYPAFAYVNENLDDGGAVLSLDPRLHFLDMAANHNPWHLDFALKHGHGPLVWLERSGIRYVILPVTWLHETREPLPNLSPPLFLVEETDRWRNDTQHFRRIWARDLPRPGSETLERVEIYRFLGRNPE